MKNKGFISTIIILLVLVSIVTINTLFFTSSPEKTLIDSFKTSGANIVSSEVYFKGKINWIKKGSTEKLGQIASELALGLGCPEKDVSSKTINNDELEGVEINGISGSNLSIAISAVLGKENDNNSYITLSIVDKDGIQDIDVLKRKVNSILGKYGINTSVNSCLTGNYPGKLSNDRLNEICADIFKASGARKVEGINESNLISVSAYAPSIGQAVEVNGRKINLNLAIRYNSYENKTYIWLATPVIITEY